LTSIDDWAFQGVLSRVTIGTISETNFHTEAFLGNLPDVYFAAGGGAGTYTRATGLSAWVKE